MNTAAKILLADDSAFMRKVLIDILSSEGLKNFTEVENGQQAIDKIKSDKPDLVLLDVIMPEVDGLEVLKQVGKDTKIIIVSAVGQEQMIAEAKQNGAVGYIVKPFDRSQVLEEVKKVLT